MLGCGVFDRRKVRLYDAEAEWGKKAEIDGGKRKDVPMEVADRLKALERENRTFGRHASSSRGPMHILLRQNSPLVQAMIGIIDHQRQAYGVKPIGNIALAEAEERHYPMLEQSAPAT